MLHARRGPLTLAIFLSLLPLARQVGAAQVPTETAPKPVYLQVGSSIDLQSAAKLMREHKFADAIKLLRPMVEKFPLDVHVRGHYAASLLGMGRFVQCREQMSVTLSWQPNLVEGYAVRATAAARMGNLKAAQRDIDSAVTLDPQDTRGIIALVKSQLAACRKLMPEKAAAELHAELLAAAREGESLDKLIARAKHVAWASNAGRNRGDETYSERIRELSWALQADPNNPDRLAALGRFLVDENDVRGDWVEPPRVMAYYRVQDKSLKEAEAVAARRLLNRALAIKNDHVPALLGLAKLEYRTLMYANAEVYMNRAIATKTNDREVLWLARDLASIAAGQKMAAAMSLRTAKKWTEKHNGVIYEYTRYPSSRDYRMANGLDGQADILLARAQAYLRQIMKNLDNDPASCDFLGCMAFRVKDYRSAQLHWERAIRLDPNEREYRYSLANAYARQNIVPQYLMQATVGRAMEHHSAAAQLQLAYSYVAQKRWAEARMMLAAAISVDPADPRAVAYLGAMAEGRGQKKEALAMYSAALALEEACAAERGCSWMTGSGYWFVKDLARAMELKMRVALLTEPTDPDTALALYLQGVKIESYIGDHALKLEVPAAMLPEPNLPERTGQAAPSWGELMRTNRALAARALSRMGRHKKAAEHFNALPNYDARFRAGGGKSYNRLRDHVWSNASVADAAVKTFRALGDSQHEGRWQTIAARAAREATRYELDTSQDRHVATGTSSAPSGTRR